MSPVLVAELSVNVVAEPAQLMLAEKSTVGGEQMVNATESASVQVLSVL
jgi:hypothetical protein